MRAANHHGRGTARHAGRYGYAAPHIDPAKSHGNRYWTWCGCNVFGGGGCSGLEVAELSFYKKRFTSGVEARNERYRARRQLDRVRTVEQLYANRVTQPEESLLYIGDKDFRGRVPPDTLWACFREYLDWEADYSREHGEFYRPLSAAMHVDEKGQIHVHERGVYQYQDAGGEWQVGQAAALEAAGFPLPDPDAARDKANNRKTVWDALRRERWLDIVEAAGFSVEREPEEERPHVGLEAYQYIQDEKRKAEEARQRAVEARQEALEAQAIAEADREVTRASKRRQEALEGRAVDELDAARREADRILREARVQADQTLKAQRDALAAREAVVAERESDLDAIGRAKLARRKQLREERNAQRVQDGVALAGDILDVPGHGPQGREK